LTSRHTRPRQAASWEGHQRLRRTWRSMVEQAPSCAIVGAMLKREARRWPSWHGGRRSHE
jgi:hypothetical protein